MLHTLINSPFKSNLILLNKILTKKDDLIILQDGVLLALKNNIFLKKNFFKKKKNYVLLNDLKARGILFSNISKFFIPISYKYFVNLTENHKQQILW
ncbi:sulfurtransferase complex subunit TusB [Buchnera aphidicola (Periphyllus koelreuteriae)]|uniref:sulfurtransferase complex subunit TusB n=1 Tax=Buchnera aphidicola TaxID=9 RepID=UPI0031B82276